MWILIIGLLLLAIVALIAGYVRNKKIQRKIDEGIIEKFPEVTELDVECCGQHEVCERESLLAAVSKKIEYYDDEELDKYVNKGSDEYNSQEIEQFRDIFYTMQETDVAGWVRSLQLRNINLPDELKDEIFLIVGERRI
ncbi:phospholipase [uncultured Bacteroides sp.]|uniref:phospholipase n=1 Tax=uncultured Bacteroides sp. TaxID=162156 RepID=UPI002AAC47F2|nr:phospholipase [uncultured Bacteroides sp.]